MDTAKLIEELKQQIQDMRCCGNCNPENRCATCNNLSEWEFRKETKLTKKFDKKINKRR